MSEIVISSELTSRLSLVKERLQMLSFGLHDQALVAPAAWQEVSDPLLVGVSDDFLVGVEALDLAGRIYSQLEYKTPWQQSRQTAMAIGYVMASDEVIQLAHAVNEAKASFEQFVVALSDQKGMKNVFRRNEKVQQILSGVGYNRLSLLQVYRRLPIVELPLKRIAFSWVSKPAVVKITPADASTLLDHLLARYPDRAVSYSTQLHALGKLPRNTPLVRVLQTSTGLKARLVGVEKQTTTTGKTYYPRITASMPLLLARQAFTPEIILPKPRGEVQGALGGKASQRGELIAPSINVWTKCSMI